MSLTDLKTFPLPKRLKTARQNAGLSQTNLGILTGMDPSSASGRINHYERGRHAPDFQTAARLASSLGVPVTYLYATDDLQAELLLLFDGLSQKRKLELLNNLANRA